jgi:hypothetical protein
VSPAVTRPYFFLAVFFAAFFAAFFAIRILPPLHLGFWVRAATATSLATARLGTTREAGALFYY